MTLDQWAVPWPLAYEGAVGGAEWSFCSVLATRELPCSEAHCCWRVCHLLLRVDPVPILGRPFSSVPQAGVSSCVSYTPLRINPNPASVPSSGSLPHSLCPGHSDLSPVLETHQVLPISGPKDLQLLLLQRAFLQIFTGERPPHSVFNSSIVSSQRTSRPPQLKPSVPPLPLPLILLLPRPRSYVFPAAVTRT